MMWFWQLKNCLIIAPADHVAPSPGIKMIKSSSQQAHCWLLMTRLLVCNISLCFLPDYLEKIPQEGQEAKDVLDIIRHSHFDKGFTSHWKPVRVELVKNKHLDQEYEGKMISTALANVRKQSMQSCHVTLDISRSPIDFQWGSRKYPG